MDSIFEEAHDAQRKASDNYNKTAEALANACDATMSPYSTTSPPIVGKALQTILELQMFYHDERMGVVIERGVERGQVKGFLRAVNEKVEEVEQVLVKKYGIHTVDDEGNPLEMQDLERVIDVMASVPGIENI